MNSWTVFLNIFVDFSDHPHPNGATSYKLTINDYSILYSTDCEHLNNKLNSNVSRLTFFLLSFCLLLFLIAFALINNTIRLSVYSKRFLIRTMRLVGATNSFIQKPFLIKGIYQGVYSSIFAIFMLIGSIQLIHNETASMLNITDLKIISLILILIFISGFLLSWVSTFFAVRKFINQKNVVTDLHKEINNNKKFCEGIPN